MAVTGLYPTRLVEDLQKSGIQAPDIRAKVLTDAEKHATGAPMGSDGYAIPYFDARGKVLPFYRVKLYDSEPKYRQVLDSLNHIYFPPRFAEVLAKPETEYIILTEGEKKAAAAVRAGFACCSVSGVDSWRNRTIALPKDIKLSAQPNGSLRARLPAGGAPTELGSTLAEGLEDVISILLNRKLPLIILYDRDGDTIKEPVARAAALLAFELRHRGVPIHQIRQGHLPAIEGLDKVGLDDYLLWAEARSDQSGGGAKSLDDLCRRVIAQRSAFPRYPNIRAFVNSRLSRSNLPRSEQQSTALAILSDLDGRGQRLRASDADELYYFDNEAKRLTQVNFANQSEWAKSPWAIKLYQDYGITYNDVKIMPWLASQYSAESPVSDVKPEKVLCWRGDTFYFQISDGQSVRVTKDEIKVLNNGDDDVLFEAGMVQGIDSKDLLSALAKVPSELPNNWYGILREARIRDSEEDHQRRLLSLLYHVSPWFYKWRGTQLPVEITTGEPGSGKSTLYELRLDILTGVPKLRNAPNDMRDWAAGVGSVGGMHVTDNVQMADNSLRQKLSDEICRLITEPNPSIEARKLYTNGQIVSVPVRCVFAITAIKQPFQNVDIVQRAIITDLDKGTDLNLEYDGEWEAHMLQRHGGRAGWLAHHLTFIQQFLKLLPTEWGSRYKAKYRLINVEQLLIMAAKVFGEDHGWIRDYLEASRDVRLSDTDWALAALQAWAQEQRDSYGPLVTAELFSTGDISQWTQTEDEFAECKVTQTGRSLARYLYQNKHMVANLVGLTPGPMRQNKQYFQLSRDDPKIGSKDKG